MHFSVQCIKLSLVLHRMFSLSIYVSKVILSFLRLWNQVSEGLYHDWKYFDLFWRQIHFYLRCCLAHIIICLANRKKQWDMPCYIQRDQASCKSWKALIFHQDLFSLFFTKKAGGWGLSKVVAMTDWNVNKTRFRICL